MDDYDDDLDSPEENQPAEVPEAVTFADLKKARKEAEGLRKRLKEAQDQVLTTRFDSTVLELIPEEVSDFDRRVALAEKYQERFAASGTQPQTEQATAEVPTEEPTPEDTRLAAVGEGPSGATSPGGLSPEEAIQLAIADPERYRQMRDSGAVQLERLPGSNR